MNLTLKSLPTLHSKSVGAIVLTPKHHVLLVFQAKNKYWEFPKGKVQPGERERDTLVRELFEETGIRRFEVIPQFRKVLHYDFRMNKKLVRRTVVYYLLLTRDRVKLSDEHCQYVWLPLPRAKHRLKHLTQRSLIDDVMKKLYG